MTDTTVTNATYPVYYLTDVKHAVCVGRVQHGR